MALVVVPRLMARLRHERHTAPPGEAVWQATTLLVSGGGRALRACSGRAAGGSVP
jgi:hypothetical protein